MPLVAPTQKGCGPVSMVDTEESAKPLQMHSQLPRAELPNPESKEDPYWET